MLSIIVAADRIQIEQVLANLVRNAIEAAAHREKLRRRSGSMNSKYEAALVDCVKFNFTEGPWTRSVYRRGSGPAVIVIHEIPAYIRW